MTQKSLYLIGSVHVLICSTFLSNKPSGVSSIHPQLQHTSPSVISVLMYNSNCGQSQRWHPSQPFPRRSQCSMTTRAWGVKANPANIQLQISHPTLTGLQISEVSINSLLEKSVSSSLSLSLASLVPSCRLPFSQLFLSLSPYMFGSNMNEHSEKLAKAQTNWTTRLMRHMTFDTTTKR